MRTSTHRLVIGRRQALAVVAYGGVVIALLAVSLLLVADLRDKAAEVAAAQMRLDQLSERSQPSLLASSASNAGVSGSPFLDGKTITIAGAALQQRIEAAAAQAASQCRQRGEAGALVDGDKLDPRQQAHESRLGATDDPGQPGRRPRALQRAHEGHDVTGIADSREPQDAHALRWRNGMSHAEDFALADRGGGAAETDSRRRDAI